MKLKQFLLFLLLALPCFSSAQLRSVPVLFPSRWMLVDINSWKGRARNSVQLTLPPHTVKLVYIVSTVTDRALVFDRVSNLGKSLLLYKLNYHRTHKYLYEYLADVYCGKPEDSAKSAAFLRPIDTVSNVGAYLFTDSLNALAFDKGKPTECVNPYSFPKCKGQVVSLDIIDDPEANNLWVGIANPSNSKAIYVTIEAAAIVALPKDSTAALPIDEPLEQEVGYKEASFPGTRDWGHYISDNRNEMFHQPNTCVTVTGRITEKGRLQEVSVVVAGDYELDAEVVNVLNKMPLWNPATRSGVPVSSRIFLQYCY